MYLLSRNEVRIDTPNRPGQRLEVSVYCVHMIYHSENIIQAIHTIQRLNYVLSLDKLCLGAYVCVIT